MDTTDSRIDDSRMNWASRHDWFRGGRKPRGTDYWIIRVYDSVRDHDMHFNNYQDLRAWAGY